MPATVITFANYSWPLLVELYVYDTCFGGASQQSKYSYCRAYPSNGFFDKETSLILSHFSLEICVPYQSSVSFEQLLIHAVFFTLNWKNIVIITHFLYVNFSSFIKACRTESPARGIHFSVLFPYWKHHNK